MDTKETPKPSEIKTYRLSDDAMTPNLRLILDVVPGMGQTLTRADAICAVAKKAKRSLPPPATRPFDPRSLVGMPQSARKRAARLFSIDERGQRARPSLTRYAHILWHRNYRKWRELGRQLYRDARAKYRIGERLRPCPGCCACKSKLAIKRALKRAGHSVYASLLKHGQAWICGKLIITIATNSINQIHTGRNHCDGSGILPAKRQP